MTAPVDFLVTRIAKTGSVMNVTSYCVLVAMVGDDVMLSGTSNRVAVLSLNCKHKHIYYCIHTA